MKNPCRLSLEGNHFLVGNLERTNTKAFELAQHFVMVAGEVSNLCSFGKQSHDVLDNLHMRLGPIAFAELPDVNDVAIEDESFGLNRFEVTQQFFGMTAVRAKVHIGNDHQFYFAFSFLAQRL